MKTKMITLASLLAMNFSILFAGNDLTTTAPVTNSTSINIQSLIPVTPAVATFEDFVPSSLPEISGLSPATPAEAEFEESPSEISPNTLAPVTPAEADFE